MSQENDGKKTLNSAILYSIANIVSIIVSMVAIPILTNILNTGEMGIAVSFITIKNLLSYVVLLSIYTTIDKAILDYKEKADEYLSTIYMVSTISLIIFFLIYLIFQNPINTLLGIDTGLMCLMFFIIFCTNGFNLQTTFWNFKNKYVTNFILSLLASPVSQIVSILLVVLMTKHRYIGRIIGVDSFSIILGIIFGVLILINGKFTFKKEYAKYALMICIPIIPHLVSQLLLSQSDLIMIKSFCGSDYAGIYSLSYTISTVLYTVLLQLLRPWSPWVYRRLDNNDSASVNSKSKLFIIFGFILSIGLMTISPELINIFLNKSYSAARLIVPSLILGVFFQFIYTFFYDVEYFHKKTKYITISSLGAALINIILNFLLIPRFGYMVAGYTTVVGYMFLALFHYLYMKKVDKRNIYDIKNILFLSLIMIIFTALNVLFIDNILVRYMIFLVVFIFLFVKYYKDYINILNVYLRKNNSSYFSKLFQNILSFNRKFPKLGFYVSTFFQFILYTTDKCWKLLCFPRVKKEAPVKKQVLFIFLYNLGDLVIWLDSAKKFSHYFHDKGYEVTIVCQNAFAEFLRRQDIFDNVLGINMNDHITKLNKRYSLYKEVLKYDYEYVINPLGIEAILGSDILLASLVDASHKITYYETDNFSTITKIPKITRNIFTEIIEIDSTIYKSQDDIHVKFLNEFTKGKYQRNFSELIRTDIDLDIPKKYFIVFPSASTSSRAWPAERFAEIASRIYKITKLPIVLVGTANDRASIEKFTALIPDIPVYNYVEKTSILELVELVRHSSLTITNDTGTYHIAISTHSPVVVIAPSAHYSRFIAYGKRSKSYAMPIISPRYECLDCRYRCIHKDQMNSIWPCLNDIDTDYVWNKISSFIEKLK